MAVTARARRPRWDAALCVLVLATWLVRLTGRHGVPPVDLVTYFYPTYEETYRRIAHGVLPLWNPYQLCGMPWLATLQGGFFYPLHALYLVLPVNVGLALSNATHLLLTAVGTAVFARRAGLPPLAALLAAALFGLRGLIAGSLNSPNYLEASAWLPIGALAVLELVRFRRVAWGMALLAASTALSVLAGYPQPMVYVVYTWVTLFVALVVGEGVDVRRWMTAALAFGGALAAGFLGGAIQLLPALELTHLGTHRDLTLDAMQPFGSIHALTLKALLAGDPFAWGVAALALATTAVADTRHRTLAWWAIGWATLSALFSLGADGPLFALYRHLPPLAWFRFPDRILGVTDFAIAIAAGIGLAGLGDDGAARRAPALVALAAVAGFLVAGRAVGLGNRTTVVTAFAVVTGVLLFARVAGVRGMIAPALVVLVLVEILSGPWNDRVSYSSDVFQRFRRHEQTFRAVADAVGSSRVWLYGGLAEMLPDFALKLATRYGLRSIGDYEPLNPGRQAEYFSWFANAEPYDRRHRGLYPGTIDTFEPPPGVPPYATRRRLMDLAAVRFLVVPAGLVTSTAEVSDFVRDAGWVRRPIGDPDLAVFENPNVVPRTFVVYAARSAPPLEALLATISRDDYDPLALVYVEGAVPAGTTSARGTPARFVTDDERVVEVEATLAQDGLVVLGDPYYPGWRATIDGAPTPIVAVNHLFRGVRAPAGTHRVRFEYRPASVALGAIASVVGWSAIAILTFRARRRTTLSGS
jgi:hypothetical protein